MSVRARPVPPAARQDAWGVSGKSMGDISFKANPVVQFNVSARQRPQSAIATVNRKPLSQSMISGGNEGVRITWEPELSKRPASQQDDVLSRHQSQKIAQTQGSNVPPLNKSQLHSTNSSAPSCMKSEQNAAPQPVEVGSSHGLDSRQEFTGSSGTTLPGARKRPISAMANMSRGAPSAQEKTEIEELKQEIMDITRTAVRSAVLDEPGKSGKRPASLAETEQVLRRFVCTSDASQVHITKSALLALVLERQEDYHRGVLAELAVPGDRSTKPAQNRWGLMVQLAERAREFKELLQQSSQEVEEATARVEKEKEQAKRFREERDLLRAALAQASREKNGGVRRPMSAPRIRTSKTQGEDKTPEPCAGCEEREAEVQGLTGQLAAAEARAEALQERVEELERERERWTKERAELLSRAPASPPKGGISPAEYAALQKKLLDAEAAAEKARELAAKEKAALEKSVKALEERVRALEKELAEANGKVGVLEKRLNDVTLTLKANGESSDGAVAREKELLKQIELLTKEMTEARKEAEKQGDLRERLEKELAKARVAAEKLRQQIEDDRGEADGIQKRLIAQMRELQSKISALNKEAVARTAQMSDLEGECQRLRVQAAALQEEVARLKRRLEEPQGGEEGRRQREEVAALERTVRELKAMVEQLRGEKARAEDEAMALRERLQSKERGFEEQMEEAAGAKEREMHELKRALAGTADLRKQGELDRAEVAALKEKIKQLERDLQWERGRLSALASSEVELRVLKDDLARARDAQAKAEAEVRERRGQCAALEKKLQAVMQRVETAELKLLQMEGDREETRAVENNFKMKMKALYDKRVAELEQMQKELEQQRGQQASSGALSAQLGLGRGSDGAKPPMRPATASAGGSMAARRR